VFNRAKQLDGGLSFLLKDIYLAPANRRKRILKDTRPHSNCYTVQKIDFMLSISKFIRLMENCKRFWKRLKNTAMISRAGSDRSYQVGRYLWQRVKNTIEFPLIHRCFFICNDRNLKMHFIKRNLVKVQYKAALLQTAISCKGHTYVLYVVHKMENNEHFTLEAVNPFMRLVRRVGSQWGGSHHKRWGDGTSRNDVSPYECSGTLVTGRNSPPLLTLRCSESTC